MSNAAFVDAAITSRRAIRRFLPTPVGREAVEAILEVASRAPSGSNIQPWQVTVLAGEALRGLTEALLAADRDQRDQHQDEYHYYPQQWVEPYLARRRRCGFGLYQLLGIEKGDTPRMLAQFARNYRFFDAPVGLIFTIDRIMEQGSWLDYGMFLQNIMVAARARGLDTCPQAAFATYHRVITDYLQLPPERMVVCGMALGYADPDAPENRLVTEREPVAEFSRFLGFEDAASPAG